MVKLAVVGIGRMGGVHARNIAANRIKGATLTAVCDLDKSKLVSFKNKHKNVNVYEDYREMLAKEKLDGVIVATPHYFHVEIVKAALEAGVNALSEKPVSVTVGEARRGIEAADQHKNLLYAIMFNQRTNRMYRKAKELLESGRLGYIKRVNLTVTNWYRSQFYYNMGGWRASWRGEGGGILINQCVHQLDILQWLIGMPISITASAETKHRDITVENDVVAVMNYKDDFKCVFTASGHELKGSNLLEIACDKGKIVVDKNKMRWYEFDKSETEVNASTKKGYGNTTMKEHRMNYGLGQTLKEIYRGGQQANVLRNFAAAIEGKEKLIADGREGINALSLINGIYLSAYRGKTVTLPLDAEEYDALLNELKKKEERING